MQFILGKGSNPGSKVIQKNFGSQASKRSELQRGFVEMGSEPKRGSVEMGFGPKSGSLEMGADQIHFFFTSNFCNTSR